MQILNVTISEEAATRINDFCDGLRKPVRYIPNDHQANKIITSHGSVNAFLPDYYSVYLTVDLNQRYFEANIIHELLHIKQIEQNYPVLCNKPSQLYLTDGFFVEDIGVSIYSTVLDIGVNAGLCEIGYADEVNWFAERNFAGLLSTSSHKYLNWDEKYNFANLVIKYASVLYYTNCKQDNEVKASFKDYGKVLAVAFDIRESLRKAAHNTPYTAAVTLGFIVDLLDLWDIHYIRYLDSKIRTQAEFEAFRAQYN